jgi:RNase P subunit RPR2
MLVQSACRGLLQSALPLSRALASQSLRRPKCPRCCSVLLIAEESRFDVKGRIDHDWSCDDCGNKFVTSIRVWPR